MLIVNLHQLVGQRKDPVRPLVGSSLFQIPYKDSPAQNQVPSKSLAPVQSVHVLSEQPRPLTPPAPLVNKPLPPPSPPASAADPSGSTPTQSFMPVNRQSRPPPSVFQNNQPLNGRVESSSSSIQSFSSARTSNSNPASRRPSTSNSLTSPSKRNPPFSNANLAPQILPPIANRKMIQQNPPPPPAFGRQNLPPTTAQTQMLHLSRPSSVANQDLHPATVNANMPMMMIGASSNQMGIQQQQQQNDIQGSQVSDRSDIDLPPEFAELFHVSYSLAFHLFSMRRGCPNLSLSLSSREVNPPRFHMHSVKISSHFSFFPP